MDTELLRIFRDVVRAGSFAGAARRLEIDPSQVSRGVATLERTLSVRLFERSTRKVAVTEAGQAFHDRVAPLLDDLEEATTSVRDLAQSPKGRLRVAASTAFGEACILPMLPAFLDTNPDIEVELSLSDLPVDLLATQTDVAIRLSRDAPPDTQISKLMDTRYLCVASPAWVDAHPVKHPSDLTGVDCPCFALPGFRDAWQFEKDGTVVDVRISGRLQILGASALRQYVLMGQGPSLLADWLIREDLEAGRLIDLFPDWQGGVGGMTTAAWILTPSRAYRPLKTRRFIEALRISVQRPAA